MEQNEMPFKEYLESRQKVFEESEHPDGLTWDQIKQQIIGAYYLNLTQEQINLFADAAHTFKQMEIIKFAQFAGLEGEHLADLLPPELNIPEMLTMYQNKPDAVYENALDVVRDALRSCQEDMTYFKEHVTASMQQDKDKIAALQEENANLKKMNMQQAEEIDELNRQISISADKTLADLKKQEQQKAYDAQVEALAKKKYEEKIIELEIEKRKEEEMREKIRQEMIASGEITVSQAQEKNKGFLSRFRKKEKEQEPVFVPKSFEKQPLPSNFDLAEYILSVKLTSSQLKIITVCVKAELDESIIKQLIDSHLPADQMKSIVEIILTKEEKEHQKVSAAQPPVMAAPSKSGKKKSTAKVKMEPPEDYYNPTYDEMMLGGDIYDQQ